MWPVVLLASFSLHTAIAETFVLGYLTGSQRKPGDKEYSRPGLTISGAISYAIDQVIQTHNHLSILIVLSQVNEDLRSHGSPHRIEFKVAETFGDEEISIHQVAELWRANVSGYIGPQETCVHEARMAASFNLPMISYVNKTLTIKKYSTQLLFQYCTQQETSNKKFFKTFARTRPSDTQISKSVTSLLLYYNWDKVAFFYLEQDGSASGGVAQTVLETFREAGITILKTHSWDNPRQFPYSQQTFRELVEKTYTHARSK